MSIKTIAHLAHARVTSEGGPAFKRSHFYELTAAAFGYRSYAALTAESVLYQASPDPAGLQDRIVAAIPRATELGYHADEARIIATRVCTVLSDHRIAIVRLTDLVRSLRWYHHDDSAREEEENEQDDLLHRPWDQLNLAEGDDPQEHTLLLESLRTAADRGIALAHYALALFHEPSEDADHRSDLSPYWHGQRESGVVLEGVQIEWADNWARHIAAKGSHERHLRAAAQLGHADAAVDLARYYRDTGVFDRPHDLSKQDPRDLADLAQQLGRNDDAKRWLTIAAESGDTDAMRKLIEGHDAADLQACWKWMHLAALHDVDLAEDHYRAINEDGSDYDDDVGGPAYVGGEGGVELEPLGPDEDALAQQAARAIFARTSADESSNA